MSIHDRQFPEPRRENNWGHWSPSSFEPFILRDREYYIRVNLNSSLHPRVTFRSGSVSVTVSRFEGSQSVTVQEYDNTEPVTIYYGDPEFSKVKPFWDRANTVIDRLLWEQKDNDRKAARIKREEELAIVDRVLGLKDTV